MVGIYPQNTRRIINGGNGGVIDSGGGGSCGVIDSGSVSGVSDSGGGIGVGHGYLVIIMEWLI